MKLWLKIILVVVCRLTSFIGLALEQKDDLWIESIKTGMSNRWPAGHFLRAHDFTLAHGAFPKIYHTERIKFRKMLIFEVFNATRSEAILN